MPHLSRNILVLCMVALFAVVFMPICHAAAELPPDILADKILVSAKRLQAERDFDGALEVMDKIVSLQSKHDLTLPAGFHFKYAQIALSAGKTPVAIDAVTKYLKAEGRQGEFYENALTLLDKVEEIQRAARRHLARVEKLVGEGLNHAAREAMEAARIYYVRSNLDLPLDVGFMNASLYFRGLEFRRALRAVNGFLAETDSTHRFHAEALELREKAEGMIVPLSPRWLWYRLADSRWAVDPIAKEGTTRSQFVRSIYDRSNCQNTR